MRVKYDTDDKISARELVLFITNDYHLYHSRQVPIEINLGKKWDAGEYDIEKAVKLWSYLVRAGWQAYNEQIQPYYWSRTTKQIAARELEENYRVHLKINEGNNE